MMFTRRLPVPLIAFAVLLGVLALASTVRAGDTDKWIQIGKGIFSNSNNDPKGKHHQSGRVTQVSWAEDNVWVGASHGGLWKSIINESGDLVGWVPLTDKFPGPHTLGSFAIMKGNSNNIVIGTGSYWNKFWNEGDGIYYTTDGGSSWHPASQPSTPKHVLRIVADAFDASGLTLVAATSDGIWQTYDFGKTWFSRLSGVEATDVVQDAADESRWYAGVVNNGKNDGIYLSTSYATTWAVHGTGITGSKARISLAACAKDYHYLYALVIKEKGGLNGLYRSADRGKTWQKIYDHNHKFNKDNAGQHTCAIACDPADAAHIFFGLAQAAEVKNATTATEITNETKPSIDAREIDGGHGDYNFMQFHPDGKHLHIANDGGWYFYDFDAGTVNAQGNLLGLNNLELGGPKTTASYSSLQGGLASSWSHPHVFVAGVQDNDAVRGDISADPAMTFVNIDGTHNVGDGRHVSIDPNDDNRIGFAANTQHLRYLSYDGGTSAKGVDLGLSKEKSAPVLIDPAPGITRPQMFTADQNISGSGGVLLSGVYYNDVASPANPWKLVFAEADAQKNALKGLISNVDKATWSFGYLLVATLAGETAAYSYSGEELGKLTRNDITPPIPDGTKNKDARINADRSVSQTGTLYYASGTGTPAVAYVSRDGGSSWTEVTGDIATVSDNASLIKLIGNPAGDTEYFLATSNGVFRGEVNKHGAVHWTDYSEGLRCHEQVEDIVINFDNVSGNPTLYIATQGRGFWRRTID
jgi:photosystem II stability/assembly factor-like uncharacterized protein